MTQPLRILKYRFDQPFGVPAPLFIPWEEDVSRVVLVAPQVSDDLFPLVWVLQPAEIFDSSTRGFYIVGTGHQWDGDEFEWVGSVICDGGRFVWHVVAARELTWE